MNDGGAGIFGIAKSRQHARVVGPWILSNHQDDFGLVKILEVDRSLSYTNRLNQAFAA